jgi:transposase
MNNESGQKKRRTYGANLKLEAVKLILDEGYTIAESARALGVPEKLVGRWKQKHLSQNTGSESEELKQLRMENKRLRMEKEILKKAAAFFANDNI